MNNLKTIGTFLKDAREAKSLSLEELAQKTKINLKLLQNLEDDQLSNLPNKIYVIGFVKSYAKNLNLNEEEALLSLNYTYEQKITQDAVQNEAPIQSEESSIDIEDSARAVFKSFYNKKALVLIACSIVLIIIIKSAISFFGNIAKEKVSFDKVEVLKPLENNDQLITTDKVPEAQPTLENKPEPKKVEEVEAPAKEVEPKVLEPKEKVIDLKGKLPFKKFSPAPSVLYQVLPEAEENNDSSLIPDKYKNATVEGLQNVYVHATQEDTWISFKVDDEKIKRYVLKKGRSVLLKGERVLLFMGNINATKIFLNNQLISAKSRTGVKSLIFPQEISSEHQLPLFPTYQGRSYTAQEYQEKMIEQ